MKPIKLTMTAFGSYAKETEIDFSKLGTGLYLITGKTRSGKTTIFDAIVFALFGIASGKMRKPEMMHCDLVSKGIDTKVVLEFEHGGSLHTVFRSIHYQQKRGQKGIYDPKGKIDAEYQEYGKPVIKGANNVTARIEEQLGLKADQFSKIVMLAQGDFRQFLDAKDEDHASILNKIFDFSEYKRYQERIQKAAKTLGDRRAEDLRSRRTVMETFLMPEGLSEAEQALYTVDHPYLLETLSALVEADTKALQECSRKKEAAEEVHQALVKQKEPAETINAKFTELEQKKVYLKNLEDIRGPYETLCTLIHRVEQAVRFVKPAAEQYDTAADTCSRLQEEILSLRNTLQLQEQICHQAAEAAAKTHADQDTVIESLGHRIRTLQESLSRYETLEALESERNTLKKQRDNETTKRDRAVRAKESTGTRLAEITALLKPLENAAADLVLAQAELQQKQEAYRELTDPKTGLLAAISGMKAPLERECEQGRGLETLRTASIAASDEAGRRFRLFMAGQAGILAQDLRKEITETGQGICPVCRSHFCTVPEHGFAEYAEEAYTQAEVDEARAKADETYRTWSEAREALTALQTLNQEKKEHLLQRAVKLFREECTWEELYASAYPETKKTQFAEAMQAAEQTAAACESACRQKNELKEEQVRLEKQKEDLDTALEASEQILQQLRVTITALETRIETERNALQYNNQKEVHTQIEHLQEEKKGREAMVHDAEHRLSEAQIKLEKTRGALETNEKELPEKSTAVKDAEISLQKACSQSGFYDRAAYEKALPGGEDEQQFMTVWNRMPEVLPESTMEAVKDLLPETLQQSLTGEAWIADRNQILHTYEETCRDTKRRIQELAGETEGLCQIDLQDLEARTAQAKAQKDAADQAYTVQYTVQKQHLQTTEQVRAVSEKLTASDEAYRKLSQLAELAGGESSEGGKFSFERYAMGQVFREILQAANVRLDLMSGGRYSLKHKIAAERKNAQAGLGIEVQDAQSGACRDTNSISGGESFQVSMSLALGLSDIVRRHAGGQRIDAMFIDEGFGSLSDEALDLAIQTLHELAGDSRQIGIISHVKRLDECIDSRIRVMSDKRGSWITE